MMCTATTHTHTANSDEDVSEFALLMMMMMMMRRCSLQRLLRFTHPVREFPCTQRGGGEGCKEAICVYDV